MKKIDFKGLRDRAYTNACNHGFHDCEYKDDHWLMLVITEVSEAVQADQKGRVGKKCKSRFDMEFNRYSALVEENKRFKCAFDKFVKDTFPDELADVIIRLLDLAGLREINIEPYNMELIPNAETLTDHCYYLCKILSENRRDDKVWLKMIIDCVISYVFSLAESMDIDMLWHIEQKIKYNELRETMHGRKY